MQTPKSVLNAVEPSPATIAGIKVQPISPLHLMALEIVESPFVAVGKVGFEACCAALVLLNLPPRNALAVARERTNAPADFDERLAGVAEIVGLENMKDLADTISEYVSAPFKLLDGQTAGGDERPLAATRAVG